MRFSNASLPSRRTSESRSEEHTSELQSRLHLVCRLLLEKKKNTRSTEVTSHGLHIASDAFLHVPNESLRDPYLPLDRNPARIGIIAPRSLRRPNDRAIAL